MISHGHELNVNRKGKVLVVARDYGQVEEDQGRPLVGPAGVLFDEVLAYAGFRREDVNITNVVQEHRPPYDDFTKHNPRHVEEGRANLDKLVKRLKPKLIITMGNEAAYHFVEGWPTGGRNIFGAKGIEDRRGYFWETKQGWVFTILHPAGVMREIVPKYELICRDFLRARQWLKGKLPREEFPKIKTLSDWGQVEQLLRNKAVAFDIETRFGSKVFCCGFTGDKLQPVVAKFGKGFKLMERLLQGSKKLRGLAHNGPYDIDILDRAGYSTALYTDDTQAAWGNALEPELAFRDEGEHGGRLTRKSLASLASLCPGMNVPFWKAEYPRPGHPEWISGYPEEDSENPQELSKLYLMGGRDSYITRRIWDPWLWPLVKEQNVEEQYRLAFETNIRCITMTRRGWRVDDKLRLERIELLEKRSNESKSVAREAGLAYIEKHELEEFKWKKQCWCCSGAKGGCWRCAGLAAMPKKKIEYAPLLGLKGKNGRHIEEALKEHTVVQLKEMFPVCDTCRGVGFKEGFEFNPYCVVPEALVLTEDLRWVPAGLLALGDKLIGFDEHTPGHSGGRRRLRPATVDQIGTAVLPTYEVLTSLGSVVASDQHQWLVQRRHGSHHSLKDVWVCTETLRQGDRIQFLVAPWDADTSYDAGRIRGLVEGEGYLTNKLHRGNCALGAITQNDGPVFREFVALVKARGFDVRVTPKGDGRSEECLTAFIKGGKAEIMRFLGTFRPSRLSWSLAWDGRATGSRGSQRAVVLDVCPQGVQEVVTIGTSTNTLIVEGMLSHNSRDQLVTLLYHHVGAPQWVFKGKVHMDEMATMRLLQWSQGGK